MANRRRRESERSFSTARSRMPTMLVFCFGIFIGAAGGVGLYDRLGLGYYFTTAHVVKPSMTTARMHKHPSAKPRFDFYQLLARQPKVALQPSHAKQSSSAVSSQSVSSEEWGNVYYLQVAALIEQREVDKLRAQLSLLGFEVYVDQVKAEVNRYRVIVGPYATLAAVYQAQNTLKKNHYSGLLRRMDRVG